MNAKIVLGLLLLAVFACQTPEKETTTEFTIENEKFELDNGLDVILHVDRSDPVVAVALTAHVGSAREVTGRTGFAHLFEHLLFLESENLGKGGLDKMSARIGGSGANGSTSRDRTNYFQTVPKDALEKMIWAEADKLGWFINTVTEHVLAKEKQVVKNEKRQSYDNRPYGHTSYVIDKNLYPEDHPYNWQVIGSLDDLQRATLDDVKQFFNRWYVPNNTTLVISGDFDVEQAKSWVKKYFDEIPRGEAVEPLPKRPGRIDEMVKLYHEDNFARLPELTLAWPTVEMYHPDSYPLTVLTRYLSDGKKAPFYQVLVEEQQLTSDVSMYNRESELAGQTHLSVRAFADTDLDTVMAAIETAFAKFEAEGISESDLDRIKAGQETRFYNGLSSVLGKGFQLAQYNIFTDDPGFIEDDIESILAVSTEDVMRVYEQYIKGKNFVATSFVPKGKLELALEGSSQAEVVEEEIIIGAEETFDPSIAATYEPTPSTFDRSQEPPYGDSPEVSTPEVWEEELKNGLEVYGIENNEVPLVQFTLVIDGGQLLESFDKLGVANLLANMMTKGTQNKTPLELEEAIEQLGASINVSAEKENITIRGNTLAKNYRQTIDLLEEILLEPRWDESEFTLAVQQVTSQLQQQQANPNAIAAIAYDRLIYGNDNVRAKNILGTMGTVHAITIADLRQYYEQYLSPSVARMHIVGDISQADAIRSLQDLADKWAAKPVAIPDAEIPDQPEASQVYFYDVPDAKQSVLRVGYPALAATDSSYYEATVMNYILGGGGFASQLTQQLREGKGYTYGIRSGFSGTDAVGPFTISSGVRSNVTLESLELIKEILENYGTGYTEKDLETTKGFLIKSNARAFETARAKLGMLEDISAYDWEYDYVKNRESIVRNMTTDRIRTLVQEYLDPDKMIWLVVGDANTQLDRLQALGFGDPVLINNTVPLE
ncbi:M16 family metallopeptidase [Flavilitoribacter nigricans]|uniref:Peptidase M16 n=1 Tax=Flavilitoribacter nigricans (strain ATCC 23147 / DSM 23189 / NBRC 102662 / NCIMB 1420 / SS-2) TaxID=1122177 RepID=A0A2D0NEH1_FLAN2|nr:pitrilysin family protein [Flavilitoribacter nigricans]PHN06904.1 peptidase M16 [Flavilitoribacter nigricans DSM 23189 = NBRC 102662]